MELQRKFLLAAVAILFVAQQVTSAVSGSLHRSPRQVAPAQAVRTCGTVVGTATATTPYHFVNPNYPMRETVFSPMNCVFQVNIQPNHYGVITCDLHNGASSTFAYTDGSTAAGAVNVKYAQSGFTYTLARTTTSTKFTILGGVWGAKRRFYSCSVKAMPISNPPLPCPPCVCGKKSTTRIAGGSAVAANHEFGFMAALEYNNVLACGGTIVSPSYILTAALCVAGKTAANMRVRVGAYALDTPTAGELSLTVSEIITHENYVAATHDFDVALLKLTTPLTFTATNGLYPICLASGTNQFDTQQGTATGWGLATAGATTHENILKQATMTGTGAGTAGCTNTLASYADPWKMCFTATNAGICPKDCGGPVFHQVAGTDPYYEQMGVSVLGGCENFALENVFSRVSSNYWWIQSKISSGTVCTHP